MADKKYQVFVSSTYKDLVDQRLAVSKSILDLGQIPAAMEYFPAMDEDQLRYIKRIIDQCDYYVLIIAGKYGSIDQEGISYTEREYEYALEKGKFVLGFPFKNIERLPRDQTEIDPVIVEKLENFRKKVMTGRLVRMWETQQELDLNVTKALAIAFNEFPQEGWVRSPKNSNEQLLEEINQIRKEREFYREELNKIKLEISNEFHDLAPLSQLHKFTLDIYEKYESPSYAISVEFSWEEIAYSILKIVEKENSVYLDKLNSFYSEKIYENYIGIIKGVEASSVKISSNEFEVIIAQMKAYDFIAFDRGMLCVLTKKGDDFLTKRLIIKKK